MLLHACLVGRDARGFGENLVGVRTDDVRGYYDEDSVSVVRVSAAPLGVSAQAEDNWVLVDWQDVPGAASYNIFWSTDSPPTRESGTKGEDASPPCLHGGLLGGIEHHQVVTGVAAGHRGAESDSVSATARQGVPSRFLFSSSRQKATIRQRRLP